MALEITLDGKKAYARIEGVMIRKSRLATGLRGAGWGPGAVTPDYGMTIIYHIYEDATAAKLVSTGQYLGEFDPASPLPGLSVAYGELQTKVEDFKGAKDV